MVSFKRVQERAPRRPLEARRDDFDRWDAAAKAAGLNWSEFTRRALNEAARDDRTFSLHAAANRSPQENRALEKTARGLGMLSEKPTSKNQAAAPAKTATRRAGRKG